MKKVLIVENSSNVTGAFRSMSNFCCLLQNQLEFYLAVPKGPWQQFPQFAQERFNYLEISKSITALMYAPILLWNTLKALRLISRQNIELVHVGDLYNMLGVAIKILKPKISFFIIFMTFYIQKYYDIMD